VSDRDATLDRLEDQLALYEQRSLRNQRLFTITKTVEVVAAAAIPVAVFLVTSKWLPAALGASVLLLEGLQLLNRYQQNWIADRSTTEALKHEKYLFLAKAGPYAAAPDPRRLLDERVEGLVSQEHSSWVSGGKHLRN
jgi:hypothetical protein